MQPWVSPSLSQPPASCWNQRNHKNVTASVIIPPCCLTACPRKQWLPISFSLPYTHTIISLCPTDTQIFTGCGCPFYTRGGHIGAHIYRHTGPGSVKVPLFSPLRTGANPRLSDTVTHRTSPATTDQTAETQRATAIIIKTESQYFTLRLICRRMRLQGSGYRWHQLLALINHGHKQINHLIGSQIKFYGIIIKYLKWLT